MKLLITILAIILYPFLFFIIEGKIFLTISNMTFDARRKKALDKIKKKDYSNNKETK